MNQQKRLELDLTEVEISFPKLKFFSKKEHRYLEGDLDICDIAGKYWDTFEIRILIPKNYPYGVPLVIETSKKISRDDDWHISKEGICCVDMDHELLYLARKGLRLVDFIRDKLYPFFANQLYREENGQYAKGEYKHRFDGIIQFYADKLNLPDGEVTLRFLEKLIGNSLPGRNDPCLCNSGKKYKFCHEDSMEFLKSVGLEKVQSDLAEYKKLVVTL